MSSSNESSLLRDFVIWLLWLRKGTPLIIPLVISAILFCFSFGIEVKPSMVLGWLTSAIAFFAFCFAGNVNGSPEDELFDSFAKKVIPLVAAMVFQIATDRMDDNLGEGALWTLPCVALVVIGRKVDRWIRARFILECIDSISGTVTNFCCRFAISMATLWLLVLGIVFIELTKGNMT